MATNSDGIPLFNGAEEADDMFMATMEEYDKDPVNVIDINDPVWQFLKRKKLIKYPSDISTHEVVKLLDKENSTVKDFSHYDDVDNTPQDALSEAKYAYGHIVGTQMYSREELVKNSGKRQMIDMVETKHDQLISSMTNHAATRLKGTQDFDGRKAMGLRRIVTKDASCGTIDPAAAGFGYWNPQEGLKSGGGQYALATEMRDGLRRLTRLCTYLGEKPNVLIAGEDLYDSMQAWAEDKLRMTLDEIKDSNGWGDFEMFNVNGRTVIYDSDLDPKRGELYNFNRIEVLIHKGTNFTFTPWQMFNNKIAKKRDCLVYYCVKCKRRNVNGFIQFT